MANQYRNFLAVFMLFLTCTSGFAQNNVRVSLSIMPPYSTKWSDYRPSPGNPGKMIATVQNLTNSEQRVYFRASLRGEDNGVMIYTHPDYVPATPVVLGPLESRQLYTEELMEIYDHNRLVFIGADKREIRNETRLPEGLYTFCVRAYDHRSGTVPLSAEEPVGCTSIFVQNLEAPILIQPQADGDVKSIEPQNVIFSWVQPAGLANGVRYRLKIVEMFDVTGRQMDPNVIFEASRSPVFDQEVTGNVYVYGPADHALVEGRSYAWAVRAIDPTGEASFQNGGRSEVRKFTYMPGKIDFSLLENMTALSTSAGANCDCKTDIPGGRAAGLEAGNEVKVNHYTMRVTAIEKSAGGKYTGAGTIAIPLVGGAGRLRVRFHEIKVVESGNRLVMTGGVVKGTSNNALSFIPKGDGPELAPASLSSRDIAELDNYFGQQAGQQVSNLKNSAANTGFELPFGIDKGPVTIGVTEVVFTPTQAWFNAVASMDIVDAGTTAAFEVAYACMKNDALCGDFKLKLKEELSLPSTGLRLLQGDLQGKGTYVVFDKDGFKELFIAADYQFAGGLRQTGGQDLVARLDARTTRGWNDWVADVTLPEFYLEGMESVRFSTGNNGVIYDHSDIRNPQGMPQSITVGEERYHETGSTTWHGFYIRDVSVRLPAAIQDLRSNAGEVRVSGGGFVIDRQGITGTIENTTSPVVDVANGSLGGWYASVDSFRLRFFKSGFRESNMKGALVLPASLNYLDKKNQLAYTATLTNAVGQGLNYNFTVQTKDGLKFDALFATAKIFDNSIITIDGGAGQGNRAKAVLSGELSIKSVGTIPGINSLDMPGIGFERLVFQTEAPYLSAGEVAFKLASPQKKLAGFNFSMTPPELSAQDSQNIGLTFGGELGLLEEVFTCKAEASFTLSSRIVVSGRRIKWEGTGGKINDITFAAGTKIGPVDVEGAIMYYNKENAEGFVGALTTGVDGLFRVDMRANFGVAGTGAAAYKYFDFGALVDLGAVGIPIAPPAPMAIYGFGGGLFYNMKVDTPEGERPVSNTRMEQAPKYPDQGLSTGNAEALLAYNPAGLTLTPAKGYFGLQATIFMGLTARNTLDGDASFSIAFTPHGGVQQVKFVANARVLTDYMVPLASRDNASTGVGKLSFEYDFELKYFEAHMEAKFGVLNWADPKWVRATGAISFTAGDGQWSFYAGRPVPYGTPNSVQLLRRSGDKYWFDGTSYFEIGSVVDPMPGIPDEIWQKMGNGKRTGSLSNYGAGGDPMRGRYNGSAPNGRSGMIVGASTSFDTGKLKFLMFYGSMSAMKGFDLSIVNSIDCEGMPGAGGPGGWYAEGQAYLGGSAEVGISLNLLLIKGDFPIFKGGAAAVIRAGLPDPVWIEGYVGGHFEILDGLVKGKFNLKVAIGDKCQGPYDPLAGLEIISEVQPGRSTDPLPISTMPSVTFNIEVGKYFQLDDWQSVDKEGNPRVRHFKFDRSCIEAKLNGQNVTEKLRTPTVGSDRNYVFILNPIDFNNSSFLNRNTDYHFEVTAFMMEKGATVPGTTRTLIRDNEDYNFVGNNGLPLWPQAPRSQRASQSSDAEFRTDDGFDAIEAGFFEAMLPQRGYKTVPYQYDKDMSIELNVVLDPVHYLKDAKPETEYFIRVFKDNVRTGPDFPARFNHHIKTVQHRGPGSRDTQRVNEGFTTINYPRIPLERSADYSFLLVMKNREQAAAVTISRTEESALLNTILNANDRSLLAETKLIRTKATVSNALAGGERVLGGYSFRTSRYPTYEAKSASYKVKSVQMKMSMARDLRLIDQVRDKASYAKAITIATPRNTALQILNAWVKPDAQGNYVVRTGEQLAIDHFHFPATADYMGSERKSDLDELPARNMNLRILDFLAEKTGIARSKFSWEIEVVNCQGSNVEVSRNGGDRYNWVNVINTVPTPILYDVPATSTPAEEGGGGQSLSGSGASRTVGGSFYAMDLNRTMQSSGNFLTEQFQQTVGRFSAVPATTKCTIREGVLVTNPVQHVIDKVINSRINPADAYGNIANNPGLEVLNNAAAWQSINNAVQQFGNNQIDQNQLEIQVGNALNR